MNIILLSIWVKILLITGLCIYYNKIIINNYIKSVTPKQPVTNTKCEYQNIPSISLDKLEKCKLVSGIQTYVYTENNVDYEISETEQFYTKVCSGFCVDGLTPINTCKTEANQKLYDQCETLLKPQEGCVASSKPLVNVINGSNKDYYYPIAPLNKLVSCS